MRALAAGLLVFLMAGCGGEEADPSALRGEPWVLSSGLDVAGWERYAPSATFAEVVGGSTGCNRFTAPYTLDGDGLRLGRIAVTRMSCPPPADAVERAYLDALERVGRWRVDDEGLVLLDDDGAELLRYTVASPLGAWKVTSFLQGDGVSSPLPETELTAVFEADGTLSGSAGCNSYATPYRSSRGTLEISEPAAGEKDCARPAGIMEQEYAFLGALPAAVAYRIDGSMLSLLTGDGTFVATLERVP